MSDQVLCGWRIRSDLPLPELAAWRGKDGPPDVCIRVAPPPARSPRAVQVAPRLTLEPDGAARLDVQGVGGFFVRDGREVEVFDLQVPAEDPELRLYLLGSVLVLICHQRGLLPLHGSCVRWDAQGAVAFVGPSGSGKSTLAAALTRTGLDVIGDDVCVVELRDGIPFVRPAFPRVKLWAEALPLAGLSSEDELDSRGKRHFRFVGHGAFEPAPTRLRAVYLLTTAEPGARPRVEAVTQADERLAELQLHVSRRGFAAASGRGESVFRHLMAIAAKVQVCRLVRCSEPERLDETLVALTASLSSIAAA